MKTDTNPSSEMNGHDLLRLGIPQGPQIKKALLRYNELKSQGVDFERIASKLQEEFSYKEAPKLQLRAHPLRIPMAAEAQTQEEEKNLQASKEKMEELTRCPIIERAALMPDTCPSGLEFGSIPVGGAIETSHHILPAAHSADVCCSLLATFFFSNASRHELLTALEQSTHFGPLKSPHSIADSLSQPILEQGNWKNKFLKGLEATALKHLQTQGDGNHFASLGQIAQSHNLAQALENEGYYKEAKALLAHPNQMLWSLVTHHGSRALGAQIYKRGMEEAIKQTEKVLPKIPKNLAWIDLKTPEGEEYWEAMEYSKVWTESNHKLIHTKTLEKVGVAPLCQLGNAHNFVWKNQGKILHGKGATPAWTDSQGRRLVGIIPLNMASEMLITFGKNQTEFLSFSPHGAGRNKSRTETLKAFQNPITRKLDPEKAQEALHTLTGHLDIRWGSQKPDLSESPLGYKNPTEVKRQLEHFGLADIAIEILPQGCIMAGEVEMPWRKEKQRTQNQENIVR